jgi:phage-related protein
MIKVLAPVRPLLWVASSKRNYCEFPGKVQDNLGFELFLAQTGQHPPSAKPLKGFVSGLCVACIPKEIQTRHCNCQKRH